MDKNYFKYYKSGAIIPFVLVAGTLLSLLASFLISLLIDNSNMHYYQFPSTTILIGGLIYLIDKFLWKYKPFKWLYWQKDISGRYEGVIEFNNYKDGSRDNRSFALEIEQTGSVIKLNTYFNNDNDDTSKSESKIISLSKDEFGNLSIFMNYHNIGNSVLKIPEHFGTNVLEYFNGQLKGHYYTNKNPQTKGVMIAKYAGNKLKKSF
ncbi:Cap15 family cyclic dinucleotide receptor domain-containing protein [Psychroserpens sp.]